MLLLLLLLLQGSLTTPPCTEGELDGAAVV
jgi:hypothetical protein